MIGNSTSLFEKIGVLKDYAEMLQFVNLAEKREMK